MRDTSHRERAREEGPQREQPSARADYRKRAGARRPDWSRPAFQIWPHAAQRQYVDAFTSLLVVVILSELQNGQVFGASAGSGGWLCIRLGPQRRESCPAAVRCSAIH